MSACCETWHCLKCVIFGPALEYVQNATQDQLFNSLCLEEIYLKADPEYQGSFSVPVLWDKKLNTIVNNESMELLRDLQSAFDSILPQSLRDLNLYPESRRGEIDAIADRVHHEVNLAVYRTGLAPDQETYVANATKLFATLNLIEKLIHAGGGPYVLGHDLTILDVQLFTTIVRFDVAYVGAFSCNVGQIRHEYPVIDNWLKFLYWNKDGRTAAFKETTDFDHIKTFYYTNFPALNPRGLVPLGPQPHIWGEDSVDHSKVGIGGVRIPVVQGMEAVMAGYTSV